MRSQLGPQGGLHEPKGVGHGTRARYDLVVCICGHVGLRKDRATHLQICPAVAAERGITERKNKRLHAKLKNAKILQEWNAATKIQRMFRGYLARDYIALRKKLEG